MPVETARPAPDAAQQARDLVRSALKGALATVSARLAGHPYASLVTVACEPDGAPVLLLSRLALHTQNLTHDPRASILFDGTAADGDPLAGGRVTLHGRIAPATGTSARARFLNRHPAASAYADFADFAFYRMQTAGAHFIGGFGRIVDLAPDELLIPAGIAESLAPAEDEIIAHVNADHADVLELYATGLAGRSGGGWRMTGVDPDGIDLIGAAGTARIAFPERVTSPGGVRQMLVRLAAVARGQT